MSQTIPSTDPPLGLVVESALFKPFYSPKDMLMLGVYGGCFFGKNNAFSAVNQVSYDLYTGVPVEKYLGLEYDLNQNYFTVTIPDSDRSFSMPQELKRLHFYGWFQWYSRFYYGEKSRADTFRIIQWQKAINVEWFYILNGVYEGEGDKLTDLSFLPERRQKLLEKGWDPTKNPADYGIYSKF